MSRPIRDVTRQTRKPPESKRVLFIAADIVRPDELGQVDCAPQFAAGPWKPTPQQPLSFDLIDDGFIIYLYIYYIIIGPIHIIMQIGNVCGTIKVFFFSSVILLILLPSSFSFIFYVNSIYSIIQINNVPMRLLFVFENNYNREKP